MKNFIVCNASAGSGKTFTLVKMFIDLAFHVEGASYGNESVSNVLRARLRDRYKHILAITFTKKATNEMKERIMGRLGAMASDSHSCDIAISMVDDAVKEGAIEDTEEARNKEFARLQNYAEVVHSAILHDYSDLSVFTIDSFMHRVVRTFAHDLHLPLNFDVTQRQEDISLEVVDKMMRSVGADNEEEMTELLISYMSSKMDDDKSYRIEGEILNKCNDLFKENASRYLDLLQNMKIEDFKSIITFLNRDNRAFAESLQKEAQEIMALMDGKGLAVSDFSNGSRGSIYVWIKDIADNGIVPTKLNETQKKYYNDATMGATKKSPHKATIEELHPIVKSFIDGWIRGLRRYNTRNVLIKNIYTVALMNRLNMEAHQFYSENDVLHISEFNKLISNVVSAEPAPFIYERLGTWYQDFLLDEFQDTSHLQWHNLLPLLSNAIGCDGRVFIVGDGKQAIYRFRNGDAKIFTSLPSVEYNEYGHGSNFPDAYQPLNLDANFRSMANVVDFNNNFFCWVADQLVETPTSSLRGSMVPDVYLGRENGVFLSDKRSRLWQKSRKEGGFVSVSLMKKDENEEKEHFAKRMYQALYCAIAEQRRKGYSYSDMMILTRNNKDLASICAFLSDKDVDGERIEMDSSESFLLSNCHVVLLFLSVMHYVVDPSDRTSAATVLLLLKQMGVLRNDHDDALVNGKSFDLDAVLKQEGVEFNSDYLRSLSIYECCEEIMRMFSLFVGGRGMHDEVDYVAAFLSIVSSYSNNNRQDLARFLEWYEDQEGFSAKTSEGMNAIRLITIHKAKGLESNVVFYPMLESEHRIDSSQWISVDEKICNELGINLPAAFVSLKKDEETLFPDLYGAEECEAEMDALNVLYVALTRPRQKLFVLCEKDPSKSTLAQHYINAFCQKSGWVSLNVSDKDTHSSCYTVGSDFECPAESLENKDDNQSVRRLDVLTFADWRQTIQVPFHAEPIQAGSNQAVEYGIMLHDVMSRVYHRSDVVSAVSGYAVAHGLSDAESRQLLQDVRRIVDNEQCTAFFADDADVKNECEMVCSNDGAWNHTEGGLKTFRADRLVFYQDVVYVIDYKTGVDNSAHDGHVKQVERYCEILRQMGYPHVEGYLIYTHNDVRVMKTNR